MNRLCSLSSSGLAKAMISLRIGQGSIYLFRHRKQVVVARWRR